MIFIDSKIDLGIRFGAEVRINSVRYVCTSSACYPPNTGLEYPYAYHFVEL